MLSGFLFFQFSDTNSQNLCYNTFYKEKDMGSFIEINDTLRITKEQGFPKELDYKKHISVEGGYFNAKMFEGKVFEFKEKPAIRIFKIPPVRNFLVEYTEDGKWL